MTADAEKIIKTLETRARQLILKYQQLQKDNEELQVELSAKENELQETKRENQHLQDEYANMKMAKMLEIGDTDLAAAKQRVN